MDDVLRFGPSKYDVVSIYESLVAQQIKNAPGRFGSELKVYYPRINIWSDYPFSILVGDTSTAEEKDAALLFEKYLYSLPCRGKHSTGFRPANPDVPLLTNDPTTLSTSTRTQDWKSRSPVPPSPTPPRATCSTG